MIGQRLKQFRLARGLSLDALAAKMGGIVTKQAISKYEMGKDIPSPVVVNKLAVALDVKSRDLWAQPDVTVEFVAYRRHSKLSKTEQQRVECIVTEGLEHRVRLQDLTGQTKVDLPLALFEVRSSEDADKAAIALRRHWRLGLDPIASVTGILEDHYVHVIEIDGPDGFDGISAIARDKGRSKAAAVISRRGVDGERQRLNLTHELGHLVCKIVGDLDEEKAAFRFGAAFLAPEEVIFREVGQKRHAIQAGELLLLKKRLGMSIQSILFRLRDLAVISQAHFNSWWPQINRLGWRKEEPGAMPPERPLWLKQAVLRAVSEELLATDEAQRILAEPLQQQPPLPLVERRAFLKLPIKQRRQLMAEQAAKLEHYYTSHPDLDHMGADLDDSTR